MDTDTKILEMEILAGFASLIEERARKLHRRVARLGVPDFSVDISTPFIQKRKVWSEAAGEWNTIEEPMVKVTITGEPIKIPGYVFAARLERIEDAGTVVKVLPGQTIGEKWRTAESFCDHCKTLRRRLVTYVLKDPHGVETQIGGDCLRDFMGHDLGSILSFQFDLAGMADDLECLPDGARPTCFSLESYMTAVASCIRRHGWISKKIAMEHGKECTSGTASSLLWDLSKGKAKKEEVPTQEDASRAAQCIAWVREVLSAKPKMSDYENNLVLIFSRDIVDFKHLGFAASAIATWERELGRQIEREKKYQDEKGSTYQGEIGKRQVFKGLTFVYGREMESDYGVRTMLKFRDAAGNVFMWWASGERMAFEQNGRVSTGYEQGKTYDILGTVKKHEEYNGIKQTILSRCNVDGEWYCPHCNRLIYESICKFCDLPKGSWRCVNTQCIRMNGPQDKKCACGHDLRSWYCRICSTWNFGKAKLCKCGADKHGIVQTQNQRSEA